MNIKTINLTGAEVAVKVGGGNSEIKNNGVDTIYASAASGIVAGADGVVSIPAGASVTVTDTRGTVYILGTGSVEVVGKDFVAPVFKTAASSGGGTTEDTIAREAIGAHAGNAEIHVTAEDKAKWNAVNYSNPNLLINPNFRINQLGVSGTISTPGYFVDRWKLVSGNVTISANGVMTLNGTISQTLETPISVETAVSSSAGSTSYDADTATFYLTANDEEILWAKLENGSAVTPYHEPNNAAELAKCQRYYNNYNIIANGVLGIALAQTAANAKMCMALPCAMRVTPSVTIDTNAFKLFDGSDYHDISACDLYNDANNLLVMTITSSGLETGKQYFVRANSTTNVEFSADL